MNKKLDISNTIHGMLSPLGKVKFNVPLSEYTTFKTGGNASVFIEPACEENIPKIIGILKSENIDFFIMGGGSNLLISDEGLDCAVIKISEKDLTFKKEGDLLYASAFMDKEDFIDQAIELGYGGVKFIAGVPGTVGGGIFMNAGTYMGCFIDVLKKIRIVNSDLEIEDIQVSQNDSNYRKMNLPEGVVILGGFFDLPTCENKEALKQEIKDIIDDRWSKHPMEYPSAGSVFKNPEGHSSWKLVDDCGLKGYTIGGAAVSDKHTNFIINKNSAKSSDIYELIHHIQQAVMDKFGIVLETEIKITGKF